MSLARISSATSALVAPAAATNGSGIIISRASNEPPGILDAQTRRCTVVNSRVNRLSHRLETVLACASVHLCVKAINQCHRCCIVAGLQESLTIIGSECRLTLSHSSHHD